LPRCCRSESRGLEAGIRLVLGQTADKRFVRVNAEFGVHMLGVTPADVDGRQHAYLPRQSEFVSNTEKIHEALATLQDIRLQDRSKGAVPGLSNNPDLRLDGILDTTEAVENRIIGIVPALLIFEVHGKGSVGAECESGTDLAETDEVLVAVYGPVSRCQVGINTRLVAIRTACLCRSDGGRRSGTRYLAAVR